MTPCIFTFDIEDWFQVENLRPLFSPAGWDSVPRRVADSTRVILDLLAECDIRSTFFILGWVADREKQLIRQIVDGGHEVACHGYGHVLPLQLSREEFRDDVVRARKTLEDISGQQVIGYRAPSFNIDHERLAILRDIGFSYDSSYHPFRLHDRYGHLGDLGDPIGPGVYRVESGLIELGLPVVDAGPLSLPVSGGGYFRLYPGFFFRALARRAIRNQGSYALYLHSWEFDPSQPRVNGLKWSSRFRHYNGLRRTPGRMRQLVAMLRGMDASFVTAREHLADYLAA